jgi:malate dehydrogenase
VLSGLPAGRVCTLAALDSTRLQTALAQHFGVPQDEVTGCRIYGGHGEMMAVFASTARVSGRPLVERIGTKELPAERWEEIKERVRQGGKRIIQLRGRSSFQSPAHHSVLMLEAVLDGRGYDWPCGVFVHAPADGFENILMAMETTLGAKGASWEVPLGTDAELQELRASYRHVEKLRDEVIAMGLLPPVADWPKINPRLFRG